MVKNLLLLLPFTLCSNLAAFELPGISAAQVPEPAEFRLPAPAPAAEKFAVYTVNGVEVAVPHIGGGQNLLAVLKPGLDANTLSSRLRSAFGAPAGAKALPLQPVSPAELDLAAKNPGASLVSLNQFLPPAAAALFNREPNFAGPNCFNAAFIAAGMMAPDKLRHVGNPEANQRLSMYFKSVPASALQPGDILVLNDGDHGVYYLGGGLIFHKKSYLKQHLYRITQLEKAYEPEPFEWKPGPFDSGSPFNSSEPIRKRAAWRPTGAQYAFGQASADEQAKVETILFLAGHVEKQAPRWALAKELGYFTERLLENLVSDWGPMAKSPNPVLRAYYHQLESFRDQANQSIEVELLSSPHSQSNAYNILKEVWLPRNAYSRELVGKLLAIYGKNPAALEKTLDAIGNKFEGSPLDQVKAAD
ncbi:MAG: hypothetical protein A2X35_07455 [Elusimicrobia bacterium GWA2_61_42]|nr:MAG: hypothetical protein A2X35_07455 [Elusimicrobia bacterium GWA2_61_42]OGR75049.1 MAG: hypothetical protein A2X38_01605 [Elusimicrobia bacterium GWC2_61_25]